MNGIIQTFDAADYSVVILQTNNSLAKEAEMAKYSLNMSVDGVLIMLSNETNDFSHLEILRKTGIPTLLIDKTLPNEDFATIKIDDINASYTATQKLIQREEKYTWHFGNENLEITKSRILGFQRAIYESPDQPKHDFITFKSASSVVPTLTDIFSKRAYDAIFCMSDEILVETYYFCI
ncbi:MAG: substrate-binding domain-containing protein [Saprospiraceae bacterium]|nr:substrate-binding domain-containing protein [Saprospiraceae bacterium]